MSSDDIGSPLPPPRRRAATLRIDVGPVDLLDGQFPLNLTLSDRSTGRVFDWRAGSTSFEVVNPTRATGLVAFDVSVTPLSEAPVADPRAPCPPSRRHEPSVSVPPAHHRRIGEIGRGQIVAFARRRARRATATPDRRAHRPTTTSTTIATALAE